MKKIILITFLAFFLKIIFLFNYLKYDPSLKIPQLDGQYYLDLASNLKKGLFIPKPEGFYLLAPGYSYFLALIPWKDNNYFYVYLIQVFLGTVAVGLIYHLALKIYNKRIALFSSIFFLFYGPSSYYETRILSESIFSFLLLLFFLLFFSKKTLIKALAGIVLGFLYLLRQNVILFWLFLSIWILWKNRKSLLTIIFSFPFFFVIPLINYLGTGKFFGTSAQFGIAFYMGNNPSSYGLFSDPIGFRGSINQMAKAVENYTEDKTGRDMTPFQINSFWIKETLNWAKKSPLNFLKNIFLKIQRTIDNWEYGLNEQWRRKEPWVAYLFPIPFSLIISAALAGLIFAKRFENFLPFFIFFISQILILMIFFTSSRHRFILIPVLCLWASVFFDKIFSNFKEINYKIWVIFFVTFFLSIIGVPDERRKPDPFIDFNQSRAFLEIGDLDRALFWINKAIEGNWNIPFFHLTKAEIYEKKGEDYNALKEKWFAFFSGSSDIKLLNDLGRFCLQKKKLIGAEKVFRKSIEVYPNSPAGAINLSQVLFLKGNFEEAKFWYIKGISLGGTPIPFFDSLFNTSIKEK